MWVSSIVAILPSPLSWAVRPACLDRSAGTPALEFGIDVEGHDRAVLLVLAPRLARDAPHDLELVAVGILAVERLRDAVVRGASERARRGEHLRGIGQVLDGRDLPREVVEARRAARRARRRVAHREQPEVVVVVTAGRAHEHGPATQLVRDHLE